jgi:hypothetical protein
VAVAAALLWAGCGTPKRQLEGEPQAGTWPHVECPPGSGVTAALRLDEIIGWAQADGSPKAMEAREKAEECARDHHRVDDEHCRSVLQAWTHANKVAMDPGLPPHEKEALWQLCVDELTHGP